MNRRQLLQATVGSGFLGIAGCLSDNGSGGETGEESLGRAVVRQELKVGVTGYTFIDQYASYERDRPREAQNHTSVEYNTPPTSGGQFLLVFVFAEHQGSARKHFPSGEDDTTLYYDGEAVNQFYPPYVFTNGQRDFGSYYGAISHSEAKTRGAYPPYAAQGYMVFGVPRRFDPKKVTLEIGWGWNEDPGQAQAPVTETWQLTPKSANKTAAEPPTSATHETGVTTRTQEYETDSEEPTTTGWNTVNGTHTYNSNNDDDDDESR
jgi:hypothetical protein